MKKNEQSLRDLWENIKHSNTHVVGIAEEKRSGTKSSWKHNDQRLLKCMGNFMDQRSFINSGQRNKSIYIQTFYVRLLKDKTLRKILKAEKEKWFMCRKKEVTGFSSEIRENFCPLTIGVPGLSIFGLRWNLYCRPQILRVLNSDLYYEFRILMPWDSD